MMTVSRTPMHRDAPGCPAMVSAGPAGQPRECNGVPAWTVALRRHRLFVCDRHRGEFEDAQPMTDQDRSELDGRVVRWEAALRGELWEPVGEISEVDQ